MAAILGNLLTIEILSRLLPEILLRLKSVHKFRYALINEPQFVSKHFSNSLQHKHIFLTCVVTNKSGEQEIMFSIFDVPFNSLVSVVDVNVPYHEHSRYFEIHGHSHGLVCVV